MNEYYEYFGPDYELDVKPSNMEDMNSPGYLDRVKGIVLDHLRHVGGPPSVQLQGKHDIRTLGSLPLTRCGGRHTSHTYR